MDTELGCKRSRGDRCRIPHSDSLEAPRLIDCRPRSSSVLHRASGPSRAVARAQLLSPRERMEARYARVGDRRRRAQAFGEQLAQGRDEHEMAMRLGEDRFPDAERARTARPDVSIVCVLNGRSTRA